MASIYISGGSYNFVSACIVNGVPNSGIEIDGAAHCQVTGNLVISPGQATSNTYDGIILSGTATKNTVRGNEVHADPSTRYGINVSAATCDCNVVVANVLGDLADYGTDALNDAGTGTWLTFPNDPAYGDNFVDCAPTS